MRPQWVVRKQRKRSLGCMFAIAGLFVIAVQQSPAQTFHPPSGPVPGDFRGGLVSPPLPKPRFALLDTSGAPFDFAAKTDGYITLLFFGYTHCPDMCPLQMQVVSQAFRKIPPDAAEQFKVVFVTTDPDRDSPAVLRAWLDKFNKSFVGLTGTQGAINAAQIAAKLSPAKKSPVRPDGAYEVGHSAFMFAYTKDSLAHLIYPVGVSAGDLAHDLQLLAQGARPN
jgi:protein SCO1/2